MRISILCFCILFVFSTIKSQQIIHIENKRLAAVDSGFTGNIGVGANFIQNINNIFQMNNNMQLQYTQNKHSVISLTNHNLTILNKNRIVNDGFQHIRYNYKISEPYTLEAFVQFQYNKIIKIDFRSLVGLGPRFSVLKYTKDNTERLFIGTAYMYEYEEEAYDIINRNHRWNTYVSYGRPIKEILELDLITYFQPALNNWNDIRGSIEAQIKIKITEKLFFELRQSIFFDTDPPDEIRNIFYNFSNSLRYEF